ncbi:MAG: hypothetical protein E6Y83_19960, partial [Clostridium butyricum]|nr:hypothetical protein [Clostridium butyricum]
MATKKIEIQDSNGNVYYPHTDASVVKNGSKTVAEQLNENVYKPMSATMYKLVKTTTTKKIKLIGDSI